MDNRYMGYFLGWCIFFLQGCGGDLGSSALMGEFTPALHSIEASNVNITHNPDQGFGTTMALNITVQSDKPVYAAAFDLTFDSSIIRFLKMERGTFLEGTSKNGVAYIAKMHETQKDVLVVGISQGGDDPGRKGSGVLATIHLEFLRSGCTFVEFVNRDSNNISRSQLLTPDFEPINILWSGGTFTVRMEGNTEVCVPEQQNP